MKHIFSFELYLIGCTGIIIILILSFPSQNKALVQAHQPSTENVLSESITTYTEISPLDLNNIISKPDLNTVIVDVSTAYKLGHIPSAVNIPLKELDYLVYGMDKNKSYIIYCRNNTDSMVAIQKFVEAGFQKLSRLSGGYNNWLKSKYKVEKQL